MLENLLTEQRNPYTMYIDTVSTLEMCMLLNEEDKRVAVAIRQILPQIAHAIDKVTSRLQQGGRLFYIGAGTSGRLGILDAVECPPTYSTDPQMVQGIIAGGYNAIFKAQEGAEDSLTLAKENLSNKKLTAKDCVVGIAASGRTPYVIGGLDYAKEIGALTIAISCSPQSEISTHAQIAIEALTGPEAITGSTRMKAGTAQKMILNMLSTCTMIKLGKVYSNLMVDVKSSNKKLEERARRILMEATNCDRQTAIDTLTITQGKVKPAILMLLANISYEEALSSLNNNEGFISKSLNSIKK